MIMETALAYEGFRLFCKTVWIPERTEVIKNLTNLLESIQEQKKQCTSISLRCSSVSALCGALQLGGITTAPTTLGLSLAVTTTSSVVRVASGIVGIVNDVNNNARYLQYMRDVLDIITKHAETCEKMAGLIEKIKCSPAETIFETSKCCWKILSFYKTIQNTIKEIKALRALIMFYSPNAVAIIPKASSVYMKRLTTTFGIAWEAYSIYSGISELSNLNKGNLCEEAEQLKKLISILIKEQDEIYSASLFK